MDMGSLTCATLECVLCTRNEAGKEPAVTDDSAQNTGLEELNSGPAPALK